MLPESIFLPAFVFGLVVGGTFIAFLWYGCGLRDYGREARAEKLRIKAEQYAERRRLQEIEDNRQSEGLPLPVLLRIKGMRDKNGNCVYQNPDTLCSSEIRAAIRKAVASTSFFQRRRKASGDEHRRA